MNVLFIENAGHTSAGAFHALLVLIDKLKKYGVNSYVALPDRADGIELLKKKNIPYITLRECSYTQMILVKAPLIEKIKMPFKNIAVRCAARRLVRYVKDNKIDIIHENTSACYIGKYVAKRINVKHVWHIREMLKEGYDSKLWNEISAINAFNKSDKVIAISKAVYEKYEDKIDNRKFDIIYDGVDINEFYKENRTLFSFDTIKVLAAGRVNNKKGQHIIVKAIGILWKNYGIHMELTVAGLCTDSIKKQLNQLAAEYDIQKYVNIIGQCESMSKQFEDADILISEAVNEGFGLVTVEGMLSGCLVVGADSGATSEILSENAGILVEAQNAEVLAEKLWYIYNHKDECTKIAKYGQKKAFDNFSAEKNADKIYDLYKELIK